MTPGFYSVKLSSVHMGWGQRAVDVDAKELMALVDAGMVTILPAPKGPMDGRQQQTSGEQILKFLAERPDKIDSMLDRERERLSERVRTQHTGNERTHAVHPDPVPVVAADGEPLDDDDTGTTGHAVSPREQREGFGGIA